MESGGEFSCAGNFPFSDADSSSSSSFSFSGDSSSSGEVTVEEVIFVGWVILGLSGCCSGVVIFNLSLTSYICNVKKYIF